MANVYMKSPGGISRNFKVHFPVSPNEGYSWEKDTIQGTSLALYTQTSIGRLLVDALVRTVLGDGLVPMAAPESKLLGWTQEQVGRFQEQAEAWWRLNSGSEIDYYHRNSFTELEKIALNDTLTNGDTLVHWGYRKDGDDVTPYIQLISGRMVSQNYDTDTDKSVGGVLLKNGVEVGYRVKVLGSDFSDEGVTKSVRKYNQMGRLEFSLIQLGQTSPDIVRGIPLLAHLRDDILSIDKFKDNHLAQSASEALFTAFIVNNSNEPDDSRTPFKDKMQDIAYEESSDGKDISLGVGSIIELENGQSVLFTPRGGRNADFEAYLKSILGLAFSSIGLSYEVGMNSFNASYSASRAGISGAEKNANIYRQEFVRKFCQPAWEMVIEAGILKGYIDAPGYDAMNPMVRKAVLSSTWTGSVPPRVDLKKEVDAYRLAVESGFCSRGYAVRELFGLDIDEVNDQILREGGSVSGTSSHDESGEEVGSEHLEDDEDDGEEEDEEEGGQE